MATHRYWRVLISAPVSGNVAAMTEVELRTSSRGSDTTGGITPTADSEFDVSLDADNVNDDSNSSAWASANVAGDHWVKFDYGAGNEKDIVELYIKARNDSSATTQSPKDFKLQYSDDNAAWSDQITVTGSTGWTAGEQRIFPTPGSPPTGNHHRYWRINCTATNHATHFDIAEIELRSVSAGADETETGGVAISCHDTGGFEDDKAFDSSSLTTWYVNLGSFALPHYIGWDFNAYGNEKNITQVFLTSFTGAEMVKDFDVQYSDDGSTWTTKWSETNQTGWANAEARTFTYVPPASTARPVVFICT